MKVYINLEKILNCDSWGVNGPPPIFNPDGISYGMGIRSVSAHMRLDLRYGPSMEDARKKAAEWAEKKGWEVIELADNRSDVLKEIDHMLDGEKGNDGTRRYPPPSKSQVRKWRAHISELEYMLGYYRNLIVSGEYMKEVYNKYDDGVIDDTSRQLTSGEEPQLEAV